MSEVYTSLKLKTTEPSDFQTSLQFQMLNTREEIDAYSLSNTF